MAKPVLNARTRQSKGKGAARKLRRNKQIPAIFYGPNREPLMLAMDYPELEGIIKQSAGENIILDLKVQSDGGTQTWNAILKDLQVDPIKDTYLHVDFYEISMDKEITVPVPIHLVNTPLGVEEGGILQHVRRELNVSCLPDKLIEALEVDVSQLQIGDSVHIRDIALPEGITCLDEEHLAVAVVAAPTVVPEEEVPEEEALEEGAEEEVAEGEEVEKKKAEEEKAEAESESSKESSGKPGKEKGGKGKS
ncbi:MAG: 50S ribosomal protein L25/general stress protein Ctc [Deltaproteobacteria bacterium]|nr:MAG: 50S ribosomal protein L25/general stress protein Ctc [Deltaproteobacteria bacterium]